MLTQPQSLRTGTEFFKATGTLVSVSFYTKDHKLFFAVFFKMSLEQNIIPLCHGCICSECRVRDGKSYVEETAKNLKRCSGCYIARYCSRECQKRHFKDHKEVCGYVKNLKEIIDKLEVKHPDLKDIKGQTSEHELTLLSREKGIPYKNKLQKDSYYFTLK